MNIPRSEYSTIAIELLSGLIRIPSLSREEKGTADLIEKFLSARGVQTDRKGNNVWAKNRYFDTQKPTLLLNSHHDTVKPNAGYTLNPHDPLVRDGKLFGLGSNDAGGCLVSLIMTFLHFYEQKNLPYNLVLAATGEEEISGTGGISAILDEIGPVTMGLVGEPTEMNMAVAEKGLMVLDCYAKGTSGHAAREEGVNAIYEALPDIHWFRSYAFNKESELLGPVKMTVTMINAGYQHNVIPDQCHFVVDVRTTDAYTNEETLGVIKEHVACEVAPRSTRLNSSGLPSDTAISQAADWLGVKKFGSPTLSDQALMNFPTCKIGPGKSERSHTPDEFIYLEEIGQGIEGYITLLDALFDQA